MLTDDQSVERRKSTSTITSGGDFRKPDLNSDEESASNCASSNNPLIVPRKRERRPDRAVYVPKGRRSLDPPLLNPSIITTADPELNSKRDKSLDKQFDHSSELKVIRHLEGLVVKDEVKSIDETSEFILCNNQSDNKVLSITTTTTTTTMPPQTIIMKTEPVKGESPQKKVAKSKSTNHENSKEKSQKENHKLKIDVSKEDVPSPSSSPPTKKEAVVTTTTTATNTAVRPKLKKQSSKDKSTKTSENNSAKDSSRHNNHDESSTQKSGGCGDKGEEKETTDDWDALYDDNGECLDPKFINELTSAVGKVTIEKPKSDYSVYETKVNLLNNEEFPHVLEISNFPIEFKTQDLMMLFSQYKESGFDIKWVDDTHALVVFSNARIGMISVLN